MGSGAEVVTDSSTYLVITQNAITVPAAQNLSVDPKSYLMHFY